MKHPTQTSGSHTILRNNSDLNSLIWIFLENFSSICLSISYSDSMFFIQLPLSIWLICPSLWANCCWRALSMTMCTRMYQMWEYRCVEQTLNHSVMKCIDWHWMCPCPLFLWNSPSFLWDYTWRYHWQVWSSFYAHTHTYTHSPTEKASQIVQRESN